MTKLSRSLTPATLHLQDMDVKSLGGANGPVVYYKSDTYQIDAPREQAKPNELFESSARPGKETYSVMFTPKYATFSEKL